MNQTGWLTGSCLTFEHSQCLWQNVQCPQQMYRSGARSEHKSRFAPICDTSVQFSLPIDWILSNNWVCGGEVRYCVRFPCYLLPSNILQILNRTQKDLCFFAQMQRWVQAWNTEMRLILSKVLSPLIKNTQVKHNQTDCYFLQLNELS